MSRDDMLPEALLLDEDGHLSETGLAALADGQAAIVPAGPLAHLEGCEACSGRLGQAALLSLALGEAIGGQAAPARAAYPVPLRALGAALAVAVASSAPALLDLAGALPGALGSAEGSLSPLARGLSLLARSAEAGLGPAAALASIAAALLLISTGLMITRLSPQNLPGEA